MFIAAPVPLVSAVHILRLPRMSGVFIWLATVAARSSGGRSSFEGDGSDKHPHYSRDVTVEEVRQA